MLVKTVRMIKSKYTFLPSRSINPDIFQWTNRPSSGARTFNTCMCVYFPREDGIYPSSLIQCCKDFALWWSPWPKHVARLVRRNNITIKLSCWLCLFANYIHNTIGYHLQRLRLCVCVCVASIKSSALSALTRWFTSVEYTFLPLFNTKYANLLFREC